MKKYMLTLATLIALLSGCTEVDLSKASKSSPASPTESSSGIFKEFTGTKGQYLSIDNERIDIEVDSINDGQAHYFHTTLPDGNPVYFFVVQSSDGQLRAAANGCQVCGSALQGFHQEGDFMVCNTCGNKYPLTKIATEKGGCNPAPISPDLTVNNGMVTLTLAELQDIQQFFQ